MPNHFHFSAKVWIYKGKGAWHFVTLPQKIAREINLLFGELKRGWGSLPVRVTVGEASWQTSIFTESKVQSFLLPLKADIRKKESIHVDQTIDIELEILI